ncbi:Methenyltetrahydrofolate synthase domain-containing protein [Frankliniella fusca]|uniref:Methenyltetrahydrofolate synthase domain-containing protein n=1 Tax=Frankliniella fusca TaxID=407009 RepID=A0AAE1HHM1_9NEOP|nr:Methenyltetrahydrofolate synthase domain-containing protein [Frankliniella fusca]
MTTSDEPPVPDSPSEVTKATFRKETWTKLQAEGITTSTSIFLNRIPNFKGIEDAAQRFSETEEFLKAKSIAMNADKAQEKIQYHTVQAKKTLLIQIPLLIRKGFVKAIKIPDDFPEDDIPKLTSRAAIGVHGKTVQLSEDRKVDIVVMGSIAVSKQGQRIGKGEGFADIEFAMMKKLGMLTPDTIVVTTVHDIQVYDSLPEELFKDHDVYVDLIVTPTQVIRVSPNPDRFEKYGLNWSLLSSRRLKIFPILRQLREKDVSAGDTSELKEDSDVEYRPRRRRFPTKNYRARPRPRSSTGGDGDAGDEREERAPRPRRPRRPRQSKSEGDEDGAVSGGDGEGTPRRPRRPRRFTGSRPGERKDTEGEGDGQDGEYRPRRHLRGRLPRAPVDFSLRVSNIASDVRVRDLKNALAECKVRPVNIKWRGQNGFALLHFARTGGQAGDAPASVDSIMAALRDLKVAAAEGDGVNVEPMNAVTRIEVTDEITSV